MPQGKRINPKTVISQGTGRDATLGRWPTSVSQFTITELLQILGTGQITVGEDGQINLGSGALRYNGTTGFLEFSHDGSTWQTIGSGSGGMGGGDTLFAAELGEPYTLPANTLLDTFNNDLGIKVNMLVSGSALRLDPAELDGSYERDALASTNIGSVEGKLVVDLQMIRPQANAIGNSDPATIKFDGDVTSYFADTKRILICKVEDSDDRIILQYVLDSTDNNNVAQLAVDGAPSYDSGNDETTISVDNPNNLDLDLDLSGQDIEDKLRIMPAELTVKAAAVDSPGWEALDFTEASIYNEGLIGLAGEGYFSDDANPLTGTCFASHTVFSENKQYGLRRFMENRSSTDYWVHEYSVDKGKTWHYFGGSKATSEIGYYSGQSNELGGGYQLYNRGQLKVANDGHIAFIYAEYTGSRFEVHGRYGYLQDVTPTLSNIGGGSGVISANPSFDYHGCCIAADKEDGSYIALVAGNSASDNCYLFQYNNYGANYLGAWGALNWYTGYPIAIEVEGSGTSHTVHLLSASSSVLSRNYYGYRSTEAAPTTGVSEGVIASPDYMFVIDSIVNDTYMIVLWRNDASSNLEFQYKTLATNTWSSRYVLSSFGGMDNYQGWSSTSMANYYKGREQKIVVDPTDDKHVFFIQECNDTSSSYRSPILYEVEDITNYEGITISQGGADTTDAFRNGTSKTYTGQSFTTTSTKLETVVLRGYQVGSIPSGYDMWVEIWDTSAGLPDSLVATSTNTIDPSLISTNTTGQHLSFNFARSLTLSNSTVYAIVVKSDFPIDASNYFRFGQWSTNPYAGGQGLIYNGSAWNPNTGYDYTFYIASHKMTDVGNALDRSAAPADDYFWNYESSIKLMNNTNIQMITRGCYFAGTASNFPMSGHPYRKVISFTAGGSVECDTSGELIPVTLNNEFDENIVFNVSCGNPENNSWDIITGPPNLTYDRPYQQRSGIPANIVDLVSPGAAVADSDFESGYCSNFSTNKRVSYGVTAILQSTWNIDTRDFVMEVEVKPGTGSGDRTIVGQWARNTAWGGNDWNGWVLRITSAGKTEFRWTAAYGGTQYFSVSSDASPLTIHKIRVSRVNTGLIKIERSDPLVAAGAWTEVPYGSQTGSGQKINKASTGYGEHTFGAVENVSTGSWQEYFNGYIGYYKLAIGTNAFVYEGYKDQSAIVNLQNHGHLISGENVTGVTDTIIGNNFDIPVLSSGQESALVDSYRQVFKFKDTALASGTNTKLKLEVERNTTDDQSNIQGLLFEYKK